MPGAEPAGDAAEPVDTAAVADLAEAARRHGASLWRFAVSRLGDPHEAEDVVQETFVRAQRSLEGWRGEASLRTWLHSICRNVCVDRLRARRTVVVPLDQVREARLGHRGDAAGQVADRDALRRALAELDEDAKDAVVLVDVLGFSGVEAAAVCDVPPTTLRSRLHRAHQHLITALEEGDHR